MPVINFLNQNALALQTIFLFVLVILTGAYALWTRQILKSQENTLEEIRKQGETAARAYVVVRIAVRQRVLFMLEIVNVGRSAAYELVLSLDRDIYELGEKERPIKKFQMFSSPSNVVPPGAHFIFGLWTGQQCFGNKPNPLCPARFKVTTSYESLGRRYNEEWQIDLGIFAKQLMPFNNIEESAQGILEELSKIRKG